MVQAGLPSLKAKAWSLAGEARLDSDYTAFLHTHDGLLEHWLHLSSEYRVYVLDARRDGTADCHRDARE